jgi:hypothetical protein
MSNMMKTNLKKLGAMGLVMVSILGTTAFASTGDFGAEGAQVATEYTLEDMLEYAIEDEYLAYAEYALIIDELEAGRPFTNIINAEASHIAELEALYAAYGLAVPSIDPSEYVVLPDSIEAALAAGVEAEIANIAMYEVFLEQDLSEDVSVVFEALKAASESHLAAFLRDRGDGSGTGNGVGTGEGTETRSENGNGLGEGTGNGPSIGEGICTGTGDGTATGNQMGSVTTKGTGVKNGSGNGLVGDGTRLYKNSEDCETCEDCQI